MADSLESKLVAWLKARSGEKPERIPVPIGDDAAVLRVSQGEELVVTTDAIADGTDFLLTIADPQQIGRKAIAVNLSDIAAMGAKPLAAFVSLMLPRDCTFELAKKLYAGMFPILRHYDCPLAGGDTNTWDGKLSISVTILGTVPAGKAWLRSGASPGDALLATGRFGGSIVSHHFSFQPRLVEAAWLQSRARIKAAMDVSDGLALDASRLAEASGCGVELNLTDIPIRGDAIMLADEKSPLEHALGDGEDFELLLAVDEAEAARLLNDAAVPFPLIRIGRFVAEPGLWGIDENGRRPLPPTGYQHGGNS
jgi:thiamine-monophosphate kinase